MDQLLESTLASESADPAFEQRMVGRFREKIPAPNNGLISFFTGLLRMRAAQITAVAALLLTLVQVGKLVTGERREFPQTRSAAAIAQPAEDELLAPQRDLGLAFDRQERAVRAPRHAPLELDRAPGEHAQSVGGRCPFVRGHVCPLGSRG